MSFAERQEWMNELSTAGWYQENGTGLWRHDHVNGLHNLRSAVAIMQRWIDG